MARTLLGSTYNGASLRTLANDAATALDRLDRAVVTVLNYGAKGDGTTDDTAALQAMIDDVGYFRLPEGTFPVTDELVIPSSPAGSTWAGEGMTRSQILASGMAGKSVLRVANPAALHRLIMRDFRIYGDADHAINLTTTNQVFQSEFRNLHLTSVAGSTFVATEHFSTAWYNVQTYSTGGHGFELEGGNSTVLVNCYAHNSGPGKAGYRIKAAATLIGCNGVDVGDVWGIFGASTAADGANSKHEIVLIGCNLEDFQTHAIELRFNGSLTMDRTSFVAKSSGTYETLIKGDVDGGSGWRIYERACSSSTKGATMSGASRILHKATPGLIDVSAAMFPDYYRTDEARLYTAPSLSVSAPGTTTGVSAHKFAHLDFDRSYGFHLQPPATWTANATTFAVTRIATVRTANTSATTFQTASGGVRGQRLTVIIEDAFTTIKHNYAASGRFLTTSGADITGASGDVYEFVHNGTNWKQV